MGGAAVSTLSWPSAAGGCNLSFELSGAVAGRASSRGAAGAGSFNPSVMNWSLLLRLQNAMKNPVDAFVNY
jgi:hypothetical protein